MAATSRFSAARPRLPAAAAEVQAVHRTNHTRNCMFPVLRPHSRLRTASPSARNNLSYEQMDTMYHRPAHMPAEPSPVGNLEAVRGQQRMSKWYSQPAGGRRHHFSAPDAKRLVGFSPAALCCLLPSTWSGLQRTQRHPTAPTVYHRAGTYHSPCPHQAPSVPTQFARPIPPQ